MLAAFALAFAGSLLFASQPTFRVALTSLFLIGVGMTMLQVAINPLLRAAGGEEHFAFNSVVGQLVFGAASFLSPLVYSYLVTNLKDYRRGGGRAPRSPGAPRPAGAPLGLALLGVYRGDPGDGRRPRAWRGCRASSSRPRSAPGAWATHRELLKNRMVWLYFAGIFCYVGSEQGVANWISKFLATYHGLDPQVQGARAVAMFWGLMTAGCLLGLVLLKLFDCAPGADRLRAGRDRDAQRRALRRRPGLLLRLHAASASSSRSCGRSSSRWPSTRCRTTTARSPASCAPASWAAPSSRWRWAGWATASGCAPA